MGIHRPDAGNLSFLQVGCQESVVDLGVKEHLGLVGARVDDPQGLVADGIEGFLYAWADFNGHARLPRGILANRRTTLQAQDV